jgi:hypothetical protein
LNEVESTSLELTVFWRVAFLIPPIYLDLSLRIPFFPTRSKFSHAKLIKVQAGNNATDFGTDSHSLFFGEIYFLEKMVQRGMLSKEEAGIRKALVSFSILNPCIFVYKQRNPRRIPELDLPVNYSFVLPFEG